MEFSGFTLTLASKRSRKAIATRRKSTPHPHASPEWRVHSGQNRASPPTSAELLSQLADMFPAIRDFPPVNKPISAPFAIHSASPGQPLDFAHA